MEFESFITWKQKAKCQYIYYVIIFIILSLMNLFSFSMYLLSSFYIKKNLIKKKEEEAQAKEEILSALNTLCTCQKGSINICFFSEGKKFH